MKRTISPLVLAITMTQAAIVAAESRGGAHITWNIDSCLTCHKADERGQLASRLARPCRDLCQSCHSLREGHHPVGISIPEPVSPPLLLTSKGINTCSTCHDVTQRRTDTVPWLSRSLVERLTRRPKQHDTRYLVMRNDRGQLCRNCH
jgi:hypothetical protein